MILPEEGNQPAKWVRLSDDQRHEHRIFSVRHSRFRHPIDKRQGDFVIIDAPDWVNVLALTAERELVLVKQWRFGAEAITLEVPGGVLERGEDPITGAQRELLEETGFSGENARIIGVVSPNPAIQSNRCFIVLVENARRTSAQNPDENEELVVQVTQLESVLKCAVRGEIIHALVLNALFFLQATIKEK